MKVIWTKHAGQRLEEWKKKINISKEEIEIILKNPSQIVSGDLDAFVDQNRFGDGLLRIPFKYIDKDIKILTIYWTSKINKYWKE
jgi:hypothetical protein